LGDSRSQSACDIAEGKTTVPRVYTVKGWVIEEVKELRAEAEF
jgi:hypothetical protein